jgi:hypothetical protein
VIVPGKRRIRRVRAEYVPVFRDPKTGRYMPLTVENVNTAYAPDPKSDACEGSKP